jgi:hypothetical protein
MEASLLALQAESNKVDALVLIIEPGIGRRRRRRGRSWWHKGSIEKFGTVGVAGGEVVEFWVGRWVEEVALERQVVVRHAGFIVQKRIIYLILEHHRLDPEKERWKKV